jgi:hypothetical protein
MSKEGEVAEVVMMTEMRKKAIETGTELGEMLAGMGLMTDYSGKIRVCA